MSRPIVSLSDRYEKRDGRILISGTQALVRMMLLQADRDRAAGLNTAGFVSGYRGSPLGTLDTTFQSVATAVADRNIVVRPAVNEELAATAVAGSQQSSQSPGVRFDGVFSLWYGKGPGFDRASDAIRHGNFQGASPHGGVVLAVGDDHVAKSSSIVCCSDEIVASTQIPLLYPADAHEISMYGLHGFALSRHSGSWVALKIITDVADATRAVPADEMALRFVLPPIEAPDLGLHNHWPETPLEQEMRQQDFRLPAVHAYVRANGLDTSMHKTRESRFGIVAAGKSWLDLREALDLIGLSEDRLRQFGIALYKPAMIWPLEPSGIRTFAGGLDTLLVVEEKGPFLENQIKSILYATQGAPAIWGKRAERERVLLPATGDLTPERIAFEIATLMAERTGDDCMRRAAARWRDTLAEQQQFAVPPALRKPFFCSGCPHNRSTAVPDGSRATAGIGCHGLAAYNRPRTSSFAQMGGEGVHWMGLAPFTDEKHVFANMGDGTYFHSGLLAIRQAVAANLNITYKLLYNSAVAMTGGQSVDGPLSVEQVIDQLRAEGVGRIIVSTDDPGRYPVGDDVRRKADRIDHRDDLDALQRELRDVAGVSVIIYEQMCATEKRRLRKRGKLADPVTRVFINPLVCEGCGDCSAKSNCLSVEPVETPFGTKRKINQSSCNKDYSCLTGFCPSFVTVEGGRPRKAAGVVDPATLPALPQVPAGSAAPHQRILVAGVGGSGVVTVGALLTMSGHMIGHNVAVLDQVGMAQKGGAVTSHIHVADDAIAALRIPAREADLLIACDKIVGNARDVIAAIDPGRTHVIANADVAITGDFTQDRDARPDSSLLARRMARRAGDGCFLSYPFTRLAEQLLGDAIGSNLMMVGFAYQRGWLALDLAAFMAAIELNGVAVKMNAAAFEWGRRLAHDPEGVFRAAGLADPPPEPIDAQIERRRAFLEAYQDRAYADRYIATVRRVQAAEQRMSSGHALTEASLRSLFKLMAYKDEYEVARLYADSSFAKALADQFDGAAKISFHLAPPLIARRDKMTGHLRKRRFGQWMMTGFRLLVKCRGLRGSAFDPFGYTAERRMERALIVEYEALLDRIAGALSPENLQDAARIAAMPMAIRGYGHVKAAAVAQFHTEIAHAMAAFGAQGDAPSHTSQRDRRSRMTS